MLQRFSVPDDMRAAWRVLVGLYREYLPEIDMDSASFLALPEDGVALLRELEEISSCQNQATVLSRGAKG